MRPSNPFGPAGVAIDMALDVAGMTLPLTPDPGRVPLAGSFADEGEAIRGTWSLDGRDEDVASPASAVRARLAYRKPHGSQHESQGRSS